MVSHKIRFGRDVFIAAIATGLKSVRNLLLIRFISFNLSLAEYGIWEQIAVGLALVLPWITLQLPSALLRFLPGIEDNHRWRDDFYSVFTFVVVTSSLFALLICFCKTLFFSYPHLQIFVQHANLIALLIPLSAAVNTTIILLRALRKMFTHSMLTLTQNFGEFALIGYVLSQGQGLGSALLSLAIIRASIALAGLAIAHSQFGFAPPTFKRLREYLTYTIPLVPNSSFYRIFDAGDRYVLSYFWGHTAVGTYSAAYTMSSFFTTLISPINMVLLPMMAELWNQQRIGELGDYMSQAIRYSTLLSLPALAGAIYLAPSLLPLLMPETSVSAAPFFGLLSCSFLIFGIGILGGNVLATAGLTRLLFFIDFTLAVFNLLLNLLLVPTIGIMGAVVATLLSHTCYTLTVLYKAHHIAPFHVPWLAMIHSSVGSAIMLTVLLLLNTWALFSLVGQITVGITIYTIFMLITGGIQKREVLYFARMLKGIGSQ